MAGEGCFTLYKKAAIEGYLDKINTGITARWMSGKTRMWCELYGTVLYMFKDSKRSSTGNEQLNLSQVHMVRKITTDKSNFQFEIVIKKKQNIFCASSEAECDNWIHHLQAAMTLKDQETQPSERKSTVTIGDYETITVLPEDNPAAPCIKIGATSTADAGYSEVEICSPQPQPPPSSQACGAASTASAQNTEPEVENAYSIVEVRESKPIVQSGQKGDDSGPQPTCPPPLPTSPPAADRPVVKVDSFGYAQVERRKKSIPDLLPPRKSESRPDAENKDGEFYASVQRPGTDGCKPGEPVDTAADGTSEGSSDEDDLLIATAQKMPDPIPAFPHPLQSADLEPLAALQKFLSTNRKLCRPSFSDRTVTENPVADMKRLLEDMRL